jgi:four helix bundle protein
MEEKKRQVIRTYRDLVVWQKGMDLAETAYRATETFPKAERYGLTAQMRGAAVSVPANVAEGFGRGRNAEFIRFLEIARGSLYELQTHGELARRLGLLKGKPLTDMRELTREWDRISSSLIRSLKKCREKQESA